MKYDKITQVAYKLELDEDEAQWLKSLTQNPIMGEESDKDNAIRLSFFLACGGKVHRTNGL